MNRQPVCASFRDLKIDVPQSPLERVALPAPAKAAIREKLLPLAWKNWMYVQTMIV